MKLTDEEIGEVLKIATRNYRRHMASVPEDDLDYHIIQATESAIIKKIGESDAAMIEVLAQMCESREWHYCAERIRSLGK